MVLVQRRDDVVSGPVIICIVCNHTKVHRHEWTTWHPRDSGIGVTFMVNHVLRSSVCLTALCSTAVILRPWTGGGVHHHEGRIVVKRGIVTGEPMAVITVIDMAAAHVAIVVAFAASDAVA